MKRVQAVTVVCLLRHDEPGGVDHGDGITLEGKIGDWKIFVKRSTSRYIDSCQSVDLTGNILACNNEKLLEKQAT